MDPTKTNDRSTTYEVTEVKQTGKTCKNLNDPNGDTSNPWTAYMTPITESLDSDGPTCLACHRAMTPKDLEAFTISQEPSPKEAKSFPFFGAGRPPRTAREWAKWCCISFSFIVLITILGLVAGIISILVDIARDRAGAHLRGGIAYRSVV
jgi:hypothetical protein